MSVTFLFLCNVLISRFYVISVDDINDVYTIAEIEEKLNGNSDEMSMFSQPFSGIVYATVSHFDLDKESRNYVTIRWFVHFWNQFI